MTSVALEAAATRTRWTPFLNPLAPIAGALDAASSDDDEALDLARRLVALAARTARKG